jgi:hypothetical protein
MTLHIFWGCDTVMDKSEETKTLLETVLEPALQKDGLVYLGKRK